MEYHVSFAMNRGSGVNIGSSVIETIEEINSFESLEKVIEEIQNDTGLTDITIISFQKINEWSSCPACEAGKVMEVETEIAYTCDYCGGSAKVHTDRAKEYLEKMESSGK